MHAQHRAYFLPLVGGEKQKTCVEIHQIVGEGGSCTGVGGRMDHAEGSLH